MIWITVWLQVLNAWIWYRIGRNTEKYKSLRSYLRLTKGRGAVSTKQATIATLELIMSDMENDVKEMVGKPMTAESLSVAFGKIMAAVTGIAFVMSEWVKDQPEQED